MDSVEWEHPVRRCVPWLSTREAARVLALNGLRIAEAAMERNDDPVAGGAITFVEGAAEDGEAVCQVCGTALACEVVACAKCGTLHHRDCWDFNGRCSTFGCGSLSARKASLRGPG